MTEPTDTCRPVEVDGQLVRVRGAANPSPEAADAIAAVVRAARDRMDDECQKPHLSGHDATTIRRALEALPATCRYHGDELEWGLRREACCDTGKPALLRRKAEDALKRATA